MPVQTDGEIEAGRFRKYVLFWVLLPLPVLGR